MGRITTLLFISAWLWFSGGTQFAIADARQMSQPIDHTAYNEVLKRYTSDDGGLILFDYGAVTETDRAALQGYIDQLASLTPSTMGRDEAFVYWVNLYNAQTVALILDNYPVQSIRQIKSGLISIGPWGRKLVTVEGRQLSLDDIEHGIVRATYDEPRLHYAFNCASVGCPNLKPSAWEAATLDADLDAAAVAFINHPRGVTVADNGRITVSSIYTWYKEDFGGTDESLIAHLREYATGDTAAGLENATRIHRYRYDWDLNAPSR